MASPPSVAMRATTSGRPRCPIRTMRSPSEAIALPCRGVEETPECVPGAGELSNPAVVGPEVFDEQRHSARFEPITVVDAVDELANGRDRQARGKQSSDLTDLFDRRWVEQP